MSGNTMQQSGPNAPAFPQDFKFVGPCWNPLTNKVLTQGAVEHIVFMGVTRREYFMARAPMPVPTWFYPTMRDCPAVPSINSITDPEFRERMLRWEDEGADDPEVLAWVASRNAAETEQQRWQGEFRKEVLLQWPGYWADQMLKRSGA